MMISYLDIGLTGQAIVDYNIPDLFHLIRFALARIWLQVENFCNSIAGKYMVAPLDALTKAKTLQKCTIPENGMLASASPLRIWSRSLLVRAMLKMSAEA